MLKDKKILAIDDANSIRTFLRIMLQSQGAEFHEADTAISGVKLCNNVKPDLVVLDLGLPDKDGLEILPEIKKQKQSPIVVVLTVRKESKMKDMAAKLGADAYMTKPFLVEDLLEVIEEQLSKTAS